MKVDRQERGTVLLEVILGLALFVVTVAIVSSGINSSVNAVERLRLSTHAANLSATVISEIKLGALPTLVADPEPFAAPFTNWTYQVQPLAEGDPDSAGGLQTLEVVIRNTNSAYEFRFGEMLPTVSASSTDLVSEPSDDFFDSAQE